MKAETIALIIACAGAAVWLFFMAIAWFKVLTVSPLLWILALPLAAAGVYLLVRVIHDRLENEEGDYYDRLS